MCFLFILLLLLFLLVFSVFFYFNYTSWLLESSWQFRGSKRPKTSGTNRFPSWRRMTLAFLVGVWHICLFALPTWTLCLPSSTTDVSLRRCHLSCTGPRSPFPCHQSLASRMAASTTHTSQSWTCTPSSLLPPEESQLRPLYWIPLPPSPDKPVLSRVAQWHGLSLLLGAVSHSLSFQWQLSPDLFALLCHKFPINTLYFKVVKNRSRL